MWAGMRLLITNMKPKTKETILGVKEKIMCTIGYLVVLFVTLIAGSYILSYFINKQIATTLLRQPQAKVSMTEDLFSEKESVEATVYAYNAEEAQTDSDPCTTASGLNICEAQGNYVANNCLEFGTKVVINDTVYEVQDRMNSRYGCDVYDIFFRYYEDAKNHGKQISEVIIIK